MRYFIELSYKGTPFNGWQIQPNAPSVQEEIEKALSMILKTQISIMGSSRTDTGVHAQQQFAHFDLEKPLENPDLLLYNLNGILPKTIAIKNIFEVKSDAHSRFDAISRRYLYRIIQEKNPFLYETSYFFQQKLNIEKMNEAGKVLSEYIDYQCFSKVKTDVATFNCKIEFAFWEHQADCLVFHIKADRFLRGMVRAIVGTMLEIGLEKIGLEDFRNIILSKNRQKAGMAVQAQGLTLMEVGYQENYFKQC